MGFSLRIILYCFLLFSIINIPSFLFGLEKTAEVIPTQKTISYYKYWNPSRRVLDLKGEPQSFYGQQYFQVEYNKDNRIKKGNVY